MTPLAMTPFQRHKKEWTDCQRCGLCQTRRRVVLARGRLPCDVLVVGEAPGESEDMLGVPFAGPSGRLMDHVVDRSVPGHMELNEDGVEVWVRDLRVAFTNLVGCIPRDPDAEGLGKLSEPDDEHVMACRPRLEDLVAKVAKPRLIVCVGSLAKGWLDPECKRRVRLPVDVAQVHVVHPAAILRANVAQKGLMVQRCIVAVSNAVQETFNL